jgi:hypothetical protein
MFLGKRPRAAKEQKQLPRKKRVASVVQEVRSQEKLLREKEKSFSESTGISVCEWNQFITFCTNLMIYWRYAHDKFHKCFKQRISDHGIELRCNGNASRTKIKQSHSPKHIDDSIWVDIILILDGSEEYKMIRLLRTEFNSIMMDMFIHRDWMSVDVPEYSIPSIVLRGGLRFFNKVMIEMVGNVNPFVIKLGPFVHECIDIFVLVREYGSSDQDLLKRTQDIEEEENSSTHMDSDDTLSSLSSICSNSLSGPGKRSQSTRFFYMIVPTSICEETKVHPYELSLFAFIEAKKHSSVNGRHVYENYEAISDHIRNMDKESLGEIYNNIRILKKYIFGDTNEDFNIAHIMMIQRIAVPPRTTIDNKRMVYSVKERLEDKVVLSFDRKHVQVMDLFLAIEYLRLKYRRMFKIVVADCLSWNEQEILLELETNQYDALINSIVFFESFRSKCHHSCPIYPIVAQRYLFGSLAETEQSVNVILKLIRDTRFSTQKAKRWLSHNSQDDVEYMALLPKIIKRYRTFSYLWERMVAPYNKNLGMLFGPTKRWEKKQESSEINAAKFLERLSMGRERINWGFTGFNPEIGNIYIGLEAFFSVKARHMIRYSTLKRVFNHVHQQGWFKTKYPDLMWLLETLLTGGIILNIEDYGDHDLVDIPMFLDGSKSIEKGRSDYRIWDFVHVQLFKLCADEDLPTSHVIDLFENIVMRNFDINDTMKKNVSPSNFNKYSKEMESVKHMVKDELKESKMYKADYELDYDEDSPGLRRPDEAEFFTFFVESLERLSFFHTQYGDGNDPWYRGSQKDLPKGLSRWLPFDNALVKGDKVTLQRIPVYFDEDFKPVFSDSFIPKIWGLSQKFSGDKKQIRKSLRMTSNIPSLMLSDKELLNCILAKPIRL